MSNATSDAGRRRTAGDSVMPRTAFARMTRDELLAFCREQVRVHGVGALSYAALKQHKELYPALYRHGLPQKKLIAALGLEAQYSEYRASLPVRIVDGNVAHRWSWGRCVRAAKAVQQQQSYLPSAGWFQKNGHASLVQAVYNMGRSWEDLREALGAFAGSSFVDSRSGLRWRSHPEASLSNFLCARGIEHKKGERYPLRYANHSGAKYAYYDLHFRSNKGAWINVEIWGDKPNGHAERAYEAKRRSKEAFHEGREDFLGLHFQDCFSDTTLAALLAPYIGRVEPHRFDKPTDSLIETSHWSNADELLESCRQLAATMPDGKFPTEGWLRKRGKWATRPGEPLNTMSVYIKAWLGGVRNLRDLLGQAHNSSAQWTRASALAAYRAFVDEHGVTPDQYRHRCKSDPQAITVEVAARAARVSAAVAKYAGGAAAVNEELGIHIDRTRRWTKDTILAGYQQVTSRWGVSPNQLLQDHRTGKRQLDEHYRLELQRLVDATHGVFPGGAKQVYAAISFNPPSRPRKKRTRRAH